MKNVESSPPVSETPTAPSAFEKLRALDDLTTYPQGVIARSDAAAIRGRVLLDALPLIADVVEAAETYSQFDHIRPFAGDVRAELHAALAVLRDALEERP